MTDPEDPPGLGRRPDDADGAVDRCLDELFDELAGTGAAGRRALAEAEDHLRSAAAAEVERGVPAKVAERIAVARFGSPARFAGLLRRAHRKPSLGSVISGGWLLAGLAIVALGATYLVTALDIAVLLRIHPEDAPPCPDNLDTLLVVPQPGTVVTFGPCSTSVPALHANTRFGSSALLLGSAILLARWLARRRAGLPPTPSRSPVLIAAVFAVTGLATFILPMTPLGDYLFPGGYGPFRVLDGPGLRRPIVATGIALLISIAALYWHFARARRSRYVGDTSG
jgi:hypothetical protein